jgi:hypothetical protein
MKKYLFFGVLIFMIVAVGLPVWSGGMAEQDPEQENEYYILKPDGTEQVLGGKSEHAGNGLSRAADRRSSVRSRPKDPKGDGGDVVHKPKKK